MYNLIPKRILEASDVQALTPMKGKILLIPEKLAQDVEAVVFDGDGRQACILTTNTYSEQLKWVYEWLTKAGYVLDIYYTDQTGIQIALNWYMQVQQADETQAQILQSQKEATGKNAINQILDLYPNRWSMDPGEFLMQVIRFAFQAWASDMHRQSEDEKVLLRLRLDGVMKTICEFTHMEYTAYLQKVKTYTYLEVVFPLR